MTEEHKDSQQEPAQDSGLQTPQPDQPHQKVADQVAERAGDSDEPTKTTVTEERTQVVEEPASSDSGGEE